MTFITIRGLEYRIKSLVKFVSKPEAFCRVLASAVESALREAARLSGRVVAKEHSD